MTKPKISTKQILKVVRLANLNPTKTQTSKLQKELSTVLDYASKINQLDTKNTPETAQVTNATNVTRKDEIQTNRILTQHQALAGAKTTHKGYFVVKAVI